MTVKETDAPTAQDQHDLDRAKAQAATSLGLAVAGLLATLYAALQEIIPGSHVGERAAVVGVLASALAIWKGSQARKTYRRLGEQATAIGRRAATAGLAIGWLHLALWPLGYLLLTIVYAIGFST